MGLVPRKVSSSCRLREIYFATDASGLLVRDQDAHLGLVMLNVELDRHLHAFTDLKRAFKWHAENMLAFFLRCQQRLQVKSCIVLCDHRLVCHYSTMATVAFGLRADSYRQF